MESQQVLDLFKVFFYGFYHGKPPSNHHLGNMFGPFFQAPKKQIEANWELFGRWFQL